MAGDMIERRIPDFSIAQIAESGQCFRITKVDEIFAGGTAAAPNFDGTSAAAVVNFDETSAAAAVPLDLQERVRANKSSQLWKVCALDKVLFIQENADNIIQENADNLIKGNANNIIQKDANNTHIFYCTDEEYKNIWTDYFDLNKDYSAIKKRILSLNDAYLTRAVQHGWGLRILRQSAWEATVSFIISQRNNIPRIRMLIERLCWSGIGGECICGGGCGGGCGCERFPSAEMLAARPLTDFTALGLGYRASYVRDAATSVASGRICLDEARRMCTADAIEYLMQLNGVGSKVAHCIALFGLHKIDAFPRDVWINRIIDREYGGYFDVTYDIAGIIQQYMFFYERNK
ncbi:MAG: hypothetical protein LBR89_03060 [Holosporales bacterium]|jgi:N-glycosylase/DNA lyase|nr:hypothetical protein [Holosporales bacterium]